MGFLVSMRLLSAIFSLMLLAAGVGAVVLTAVFSHYSKDLPEYQYLQDYQPPTLIVWGKNDQIFPAAGAEPYRRDLETLDFHLLDTGHFALEEDGDKIADLMRNFLHRNVKR